MNDFYRNNEHYYDPTAGEALTNISREERRRSSRKPVRAFICSRLAGNIDHNLTMAKKYTKFAIDSGYAAFCPHLLYSQVMSDDVSEEREIAIAMGKSFLAVCSVLLVFMEDGMISEGMQSEIDFAKRIRKGIAIRYFDSNCQEVTISDSD